MSFVKDAINILNSKAPRQEESDNSASDIRDTTGSDKMSVDSPSIPDSQRGGSEHDSQREGDTQSSNTEVKHQSKASSSSSTTALNSLQNMAHALPISPAEIAAIVSAEVAKLLSKIPAAQPAADVPAQPAPAPVPQPEPLTSNDAGYWDEFQPDANSGASVEAVPLAADDMHHVRAAMNKRVHVDIEFEDPEALVKHMKLIQKQVGESVPMNTWAVNSRTTLRTGGYQDKKRALNEEMRILESKYELALATETHDEAWQKLKTRHRAAIKAATAFGNKRYKKKRKPRAQVVPEDDEE
jgi:uncharacterized phage infection (PIP) family protein YhgE